MASTIISGARSILKLAGKKVALATGVSVNESVGFEPFRPLDSVAIVENIPVTYDCSMSADQVVAVGQDPTQTGIMPHVDLLSILTQPELVAELYDAVSGTLVLKVEGVMLSSNNRNFRAGQIAANDLTFVARLVKSSVESNPGITPSAGGGNPTGSGINV
jgi:hypothetical protein